MFHLDSLYDGQLRRVSVPLEDLEWSFVSLAL